MYSTHKLYVCAVHDILIKTFQISILLKQGRDFEKIEANNDTIISCFVISL